MYGLSYKKYIWMLTVTNASGNGDLISTVVILGCTLMFALGFIAGQQR